LRFHHLDGFSLAERIAAALPTSTRAEWRT
jgi:hypothetical protein